MKMHIFSFEKLNVWQDARFITENIYKITKTFPDEERYGLTNQLRRAIISVCSNLEEGSSRAHSKDLVLSDCVFKLNGSP